MTQYLTDLSVDQLRRFFSTSEVYITRCRFSRPFRVFDRARRSVRCAGSVCTLSRKPLQSSQALSGKQMVTRQPFCCCPGIHFCRNILRDILPVLRFSVGIVAS